MKVLCSIAVLAAITTVEVRALRGSKTDEGKDLFKEEDSQFWQRVLPYTHHSVPPKPTKPPVPPPPKGCDVDVFVDCKTTSGVACDQLEYPSGTCSEVIDAVTFSYTPATCAESVNSQLGDCCIDFQPFTAEGVVTVSCVDGSGAPVSVNPANVVPGETTTVTNPAGGALPASITCNIVDSVTGTIQQTCVDTSGTVPLGLKDSFGALTVESCDDLSCSEEICVTYNFDNVGSDEMTITVADRYFNGEQTDLLPFVSVNPLPAGQSTSIEEKTIIDVCAPTEYCIDLEAEADSPDGIVCQDEDSYKFTIGPKPPTPTPPPVTAAPTLPCTIDFNSTCIPPPPATDCKAIPPAVQQCEGRPLMMGMLYNGGDCSQTYTPQVQDPSKFTCEDVGLGPPTNDGDLSYIVVIDKKDGEITYHSDWVEVGSIYYLTDNDERFVADMNTTIYSSEDLSPASTLQKVTWHSSCSQNLFLKDRFGASQLVEWFNVEQGLISCFANTTFDLSVTIPIDIQGDSLTLTSLVSVTTWGVFNLTDEVNGLVLAPGDSIEASFDVTLDLTSVQRYELLTEIIGVTDTGVECRGVDFYFFTAGTDLDNLPTQSPAIGGGTGGSKKSRD